MPIKLIGGILMLSGGFDLHVSNVFRKLETTAKELGVTRVNSTMILEALLEASESPLYNALLDQTEDITYFPDMVDETRSYVQLNDDGKMSEKQEDETKISKIVFDDEGKTKTVFFADDLTEFIQLLLGCMQKEEFIDIYKFTAMFVYTMTDDVRKVFRTFGVRTDLLEKDVILSYKEHNKIKEEAKTIEIPQELKSFVRNFNEEFNGQTCDISQRDRECNLVWQTMLKQTKRNVVLLGEPGTGKTSIVIKMVYDIMNHTCPKEFEGFTILALDVTASVAGTMYRGQAEERFSNLVDYLNSQPRIILFIDEMHLINGAGACKEGEIDLANTLKPILAGGKVRVIGATTQDEYEKYFSRDGAMKRRFRPVYIKEPKTSEVYCMLKKSIETLSKYHGVSISRKMVDFIILNAACFHNETCNPDRTKDLIDLSMVVAKQAGKTFVDKKSVLANFAYHFKKFAQMSERVKRAIAYHEAGHCLVALCSKELNNIEVIAVSIMPSDAYLGLTVFESNDYTPEPSMEYYIDSIALNLAGRVAEKMFTGVITSGASADLQEATDQACDLVTKYGMSKCGMNRTFTEETTSSKDKENISSEINFIIDQSMKRAEKILSSNVNSLKLLVESLMKNGIVGANDLKQILKNVKKV